MNFEIIDARECHTHEIFTLLKELADFEHLTSEFKIDENRLREMIFDEKLINALVAVSDEKVVGIALYYTSCISTFSGKKILYLEDIYINKDFRKKGIGREIFSKLRVLAKEKDCCKIEWKCLSWNVDAGNFYKTMGSKQDEDWITFSINHI